MPLNIQVQVLRHMNCQLGLGSRDMGSSELSDLGNLGGPCGLSPNQGREEKPV
jgi:hypothetical protein